MKRVVLSPVMVTGSVLLCMIWATGIAAEDAEKKEQPFDQELWSYLKKVEYEENYSPWPGMKDEFFPGQSPHGAQLKVYVNRHVTKDPSDPPHKSVVVKENYTSEKKLASITIMYRVRNYDADNKDWYWVKYLPDGKVARMNDTKLAGKVKGCINCHSSAKGGDYIFMNDE